MKRQDKTKSKSLKLALYFGTILISIFVVSIAFKGIDLIRNSNFDGDNRFTVAVLAQDSAEILTASPVDGELFRLSITGINSKSELNEYQIPIDSYVYLNKYDLEDTKSAYTSMLSGLGNSNTNLTVFDLLRLSFFATSLDSENIIDEVLTNNDQSELIKISSEKFIDPKIVNENINIQVTNASEISGIGKKTGQYVANLGGNVVLINSSQKTEKITRLQYSKKSYTTKKLGDILNIPSEEKELSTISEIIIIIGEDAKEVLDL